MSKALATLVLLLPLAPAPAPVQGETPFAEHYLNEARQAREAGNFAQARAALERLLERNDAHLTALRGLAEVSRDMSDPDGAVYAYHRWLEVADAAPKGTVDAAEIRGVRESLATLDPDAGEFRKITDEYARELLAIAADYAKRKHYHSALRVFQQVLQVDPRNPEGSQGIDDIRRGAGDELATEDVFAGGDPTFGRDPEWIAKEDGLHADWKNAWKHETENYRYRTDAGFLVLQTSAIAMEQMNRFYRRFFRYKLDGDPTPRIEIRIFKNRDEYLALGQSPAEWSGGHFTGDSVETFVGGVTGKESIREMYGTLFHEAAHQFVSLTGKGGVPGWLNEAYASFFEGTTILSNGSVKWNQVANHRLFPLARRMERGWMTGADDGVKDASGEWADPPAAPTLRILVENEYEWGPPWYAPTWGVVYFLYNYRTTDGRPVFRDALHEYYLSGAAGRGNPVSHFEGVVLRAKDSPVRTIDELNGIWHDWILELRDRELGKTAQGKSSLEFGDVARARGDLALAAEFYEEAYAVHPNDPEVLWRLSTLLEQRGNLDRATSLYRAFAQELELRGGSEEDERYATAREKTEKLDPLAGRYSKLKDRLAKRGIDLARQYLERGLPTMALDVARRMSAQFSIPEALEFYADVALRTGKSLARWRVAYNEHDLTGWSGDATSYKAYGREIQVAVEDDPSVGARPGQFVTRELSCDVLFDSDFSLEADLRFEPGASSLMGLCFGRKDALNFHAVVLHPKGFLDVSSKTGGPWTVRDHRSAILESEWNKLRIDVADRFLDVYLNGQFVRSLEMPSRESIRGGFGLITGVGRGFYRHIRVLARDPHDPAARIEREIAMGRVAADPSARTKGSFAGMAPPTLRVSRWIQGEPVALADLHGRPATLIFWTPAQEAQIPTAAYYAHLVETYAPYGFRFVVVVNNERPEKPVRDALAEHPIPGAAIGLDDRNATYGEYYVSVEGYGLPRILVLDVDGTVAWEGDPGLSLGVGWNPAVGETFLDEPLKELLEKRHLRELVELAGTLERAEGSAEKARFAEAIAILASLADLDAAFDPEVRRARALRERILGFGSGLVEAASRDAEAGRPLAAGRIVGAVAQRFEGLPPAERARAVEAALRRDSRHAGARRAWTVLGRAVRLAEAKAAADKIRETLDGAMNEEGSLVEIQEAVGALRAALDEGGAEGFLSAWSRLESGGEDELLRRWKTGG